MAYLNQQEREALAHDLTTLNFKQAKGKLRRMDPDVKVAFLRNAQAVGEYLSRFDLFGLGTVVTLIERETETTTFTDKPGSSPIRMKAQFALDEVIVAPMPENKT